MKPKIKSTSFGSIEIDEKVYHHDVMIRLDGQIEKRKKKLSKEIYGTSHTISLDEIKHIYEYGADSLIIGTGQYGLVHLSDEATSFLKDQGCDVILFPSPEAVKVWNEQPGAAIGLFHTTC